MDKSKQAVSVFDKRARDYQSLYMDVSLYHDTLGVFIGQLQPNASVLELACGPGNVTRHLLDNRPDLQIFGTDLSPNMIDLAKSNNPEADFALMDVRDVGKSVKTYDAVLCAFGLPYLSKDEAVAFVSDLPKALNRGGIVYLSTMEGDYNSSGLQHSSDGKDSVFIHLHESGYLCDALDAAGFEIIECKRQDFPQKPGTVDLILIARWNQKS